MRFNETVRCDNAERLRKKMPSKEHYVFVDDQMLVVYYGLKSEVPSFVYGKCFESNEFWVSIIEKAVAKVHGGYVGIQEGQPPGCGLQLLTGGTTRRLRSPPDELWDELIATGGEESVWK